MPIKLSIQLQDLEYRSRHYLLSSCHRTPCFAWQKYLVTWFGNINAAALCVCMLLYISHEFVCKKMCACTCVTTHITYMCCVHMYISACDCCIRKVNKKCLLSNNFVEWNWTVSSSLLIGGNDCNVHVAVYGIRKVNEKWVTTLWVKLDNLFLIN